MPATNPSGSIIGFRFDATAGDTDSTIISVSASGKMYTFGVTRENTEQNLWNRAQNGQNGIPQSEQTEQVFDTVTIGVSADGNPSMRHDGVTLSRVAPDSPADRAGIKAGDVIVALNDHYLFTIEELNREIRRLKPGTQVAVRYRRQSTINDANLVVGVAD